MGGLFGFQIFEKLNPRIDQPITVPWGCLRRRQYLEGSFDALLEASLQLLCSVTLIKTVSPVNSRKQRDPCVKPTCRKTKAEADKKISTSGASCFPVKPTYFLKGRSLIKIEIWKCRGFDFVCP